jgi:hypothetical protein
LHALGLPAAPHTRDGFQPLQIRRSLAVSAHPKTPKPRIQPSFPDARIFS